MRSIGVKSIVPTADSTSHGDERMALRSVSAGGALSSLASLASTASLIVVPDSLLHHWRLQIDAHTAMYAAANANSVFFDDDLRRPLPPATKLAGMCLVVIPHR